MIYHISYDLQKPGRDYSALYQAIKKLGSTWCHPVDSTWYVKTSLDVKNIRDTLRTVMDSSDALIVTVASAPGAWFGLSNDISEWFNTNLD